jgi:CIC family chloride channel protein
LLEHFKFNPWVLLAFVGVAVLLKAYAAGVTIGAGGNGGNFAPSLFVGSYMGFFVATLINLTGLTRQMPVANFTVVGMAGILSGLFHAPLTAIFLIGEITGGYGLMVPLMIVSSIAFAVSKQFEKYSMDVKHLADKGEIFSDKDRNILSNIDLLQLVRTDMQTLEKEDPMDRLIELLATTKQRVFAVTDGKNNLAGIVDYDKIRPVIFSAFRIKYTPLADVISVPDEIVSIGEDGIDDVLNKFETAGTDWLPVMQNRRYLGFLHKIDVLESYRAKLREMLIE